MHKAEQFPLPIVGGPSAPGTVAKVEGFLQRVRDLQAIQNEIGGIVPQTLAAVALGISTQRVHQLLHTGQLEPVLVCETPYVSMRSLAQFVNGDRKNGRPIKGSKLTAWETFKVGWSLGGKAGDRVRKKA
jgi:hypothetical protein